MNILAVTDIHSRIGYARKLARKIKNIDVAVIAGDITDFGDINLALYIISLFQKACRNVVFVPGNCDDPKLIKVKDVRNTINLHGNYFITGDVAFLGVGGSNITPFHTPIEYTENELWDILLKLFNMLKSEREYLKILVSHTPPYNTKVDVTFFGVHAGSVSVRKAIETFKPKLCICGHIHEARGVDRIGETLIVNPGPLMRKHYTLININENSVEVVFKTV